MKILLKSLRLINFKGIESLFVRFNNETFVLGDNGTGKSTIADAWYWLLFDKNSLDESSFNIKNTVNTDLNTQDHTVEGVLDIDGQETVLRHVYREKWEKAKGAELKTYKGNTNEYFWNEVPCQKKEYQAKIAKIIDEGIFKLITNPGHFNTAITWQGRRDVLIKMAGNVSNQDVAGKNKDFLDLIAKIGNKTFKEYRTELKARITNLKDELLHLPARIDELKLTLPELEPDFVKLQAEIDDLSTELNNIDSLLGNKSVAEKQFQQEQSAIHREIGNLNRQLADLTNTLRNKLLTEDRNASNEIDLIKQRIGSLGTSFAQLQKDKEYAEVQIEACAKRRESLIADRAEINAEKFAYDDFVFDEDNKICAHCKQELPDEDINTLRQTLEGNYNSARLKAQTAFNNNKLRKLADNTTAGTNNNITKQNHEANLVNLIEAFEAKQLELNEANENLAVLEGQYVKPRPVEDRLTELLTNNKEVLSIESALKIQKALLKEEPADDNSDLKTRKVEIANRITELTKQLALKDTIQATKDRITKLSSDQKTHNQSLASAEREDYTLTRFEKERINMINDRVNSKFKYVTFKMFKDQVNGGEDPTCETMLNGVPYSDLNTAGKIKAGIDIINALSEHYGVWAPIFLDNRESVVAIPQTDSQVINLVVSEPDKVLRIEHKKPALATA